MVDVICLLKNKNYFIDEIYESIRVAERFRKIEYKACVKIQSWYRGIKVRVYLKHLSICATTIQKVWKGSKTREFFKIMRQHLREMNWKNHCDGTATKIQKIWRGYYSRKNIFNYKERKKHFQGVVLMNDIVRAELNEKMRRMERERMMQEKREEEMRFNEYAEKHHYLVSTRVVPGIYNSPYKPAADFIEFKMRQVRFGNNNSGRTRSRKQKKTVSNFFCSIADVNEGSPLPPLVKKPQGPFKEPEEVLQQKLKPIKPTLRVATDYESVQKAREQYKQDEWLRKISDNDFIVPGKLPALLYQPSICSTGPYQNALKILKKDSCVTKNFKTIFPPISTFDDGYNNQV